MKTIMLKPVVTEKSLRLAQNNQFTFNINSDVNKIEFARFLAQKYKVEVRSVRISKLPGKPKGRLRQVSGRTKAQIKAVVTLKKGQTIPGFELTKEERKSK